MRARYWLLTLLVLLGASHAAEAQIGVAVNGAECVVSTGYDASATSIDVASGCGALFGSTFPVRAVYCNWTDYPGCRNSSGTVDPNVEWVDITARSTDTLTITRAAEGPSASTKNTGGKTYRITAVSNTAAAWNALRTSLGQSPQGLTTSSSPQFATVGIGAALPSASGIGTPYFGVTNGAWSQFNSSRPPMVQFQRDFTQPPDSSPGAQQDVFRVYTSSQQSGTVSQGRVGISSFITDNASVTNKTITNAVSNGGPDLIRITATSHGYATSDVINVYGVGGTTEANGVWTITVIDANTFDLQGSTHTNAYTSGGTATNRGLLYAMRAIVSPALDRGTLTGTGANGDDVNGFVAWNVGAGRATEAFYCGTSTGVGSGAGPQVGWYACFSNASDADYGLLVTGEQPATSAITALPAAAGAFWPTYTANDTNTETRRTLSIKPTLNFGGSNTNKTLNVLEIDTTNTATTGTTTNLLSASYGGSARLTLSSGGVLALTGSQTVSTSLQAATATVTTASGTGVFNVGSPTQSPMAMNILSTDQGTLSLQRILAGTGGAGFNGYKARGSGVGSESVALSADVVMNIAGFGYDAATSGQAWPTTATVQLRGLATANHSTTDHGGKFEIRTTTEGSTTIATRATFGTTGVSIGASTAARGTTEPTNALNIFDGTAPVGTLTNGVSCYSTAGELRCMDSGGTAALLTPHDDETGEWITFMQNTRTGRVLRVDMEALVKRMDAMVGGGYVTEFVGDPSQQYGGGGQGRVIFSKLAWVPYASTLTARLQ